MINQHRNFLRQMTARINCRRDPKFGYIGVLTEGAYLVRRAISGRRNARVKHIRIPKPAFVMPKDVFMSAGKTSLWLIEPKATYTLGGYTHSGYTL